MTPGQTDVFEILELVTLEGLVPGQREFVSIKAGNLVPADMAAYTFLECACTQDGHLFCKFLQFPAAKRRCKLPSA